mgnify:CR=1 FL=1
MLLVRLHDLDNYLDEVVDDEVVEDGSKSDYAGMSVLFWGGLMCRHPATINRRRMEEVIAQKSEVEEMRQRGGTMKGITKITEDENESQRQLRKYMISPEVSSSQHS